MSSFPELQFYQVIFNMQDAEKRGENIDLALGILEYMYDDDNGYIDEFFARHKSDTELKELWEKIHGHRIRNNLD